MLNWIENNLVGNPAATMGRPIAVSATHSPASWLAQMAAIVVISALLIRAILEALV